MKLVIGGIYLTYSGTSLLITHKVDNIYFARRSDRPDDLLNWRFYESGGTAGNHSGIQKPISVPETSELSSLEEALNVVEKALKDKIKEVRDTKICISDGDFQQKAHSLQVEEDDLRVRICQFNSIKGILK